MEPQRRIVTGHGADGGSAILQDGLAPVVHELPEGSGFAEIWVTAGAPAPLSPREAEPTSADVGVAPPPAGSLVRVVETPPGARTPMHRTESIDYGVVLAGEMHLILGNGEETLLRPGDVVVQRGTEHAWENRGEEPVRMFIASVDAQFDGDLRAMLGPGVELLS